jgi:hypothetical protein
MTDANLSPVKLNGHSNLWGEPGTSDSDCDSRGNLLEYSDSDSESDTEGERGREKDIEMEREIEREGDQGYLTASDGEEGEGDDEQKWTNGSEESRKPTGSDRNGMESLSTSEGLSRLGPKRDGRIDQSPQRTRTVRTVMMKRIIKSPSVKGRNSTDREEDKDKDRPYIQFPQTAPSSSTPHTPTRVPQSLGYEGKSPPSVFVRTEISTDMRSVHSVRTPLRTSRYSRGSGVGVSVGVGADRGERGKSAEGDDMRGRREGKVKKDTDREYGMDTARNGTIFETERESRRDLSAGERKGGGVHRAEGRIADRGERTDGPSPDTPKGKGSMWHTSGQKHSVKVIPTGQSEIPLPCLLHVFFVVSWHFNAIFLSSSYPLIFILLLLVRAFSYFHARLYPPSLFLPFFFTFLFGPSLLPLLSFVLSLLVGGRLLEIAPWTWRSHPVLHFSLTSDPAQIAMLFALGEPVHDTI